MSQPAQGPRYGTPNFEYLARMAATPAEQDGPFYMVNLIKYRAVAVYADGNPGGRSGKDAAAEYLPIDILHDLGAEVVFAGEVEKQLLGEPGWDGVGVVRYPTRAAFVAMQRRGDFQARHVHKDAGVETSIVMACLPAPIPALPAPDPVALTDGDRAFLMVHVMKFAEGGEARMAAYGATAGAAGLALGVRPAAHFTVDGTVIGDGRAWDQVRFNRFPSHAAYEQLRATPVHQEGQPGRAEALSDTFAMVVLPRIDQLAATADEAGR